MGFERCVTAGLERLMPSVVYCTMENHTRFLSGLELGTAGLCERENNRWPISCP